MASDRETILAMAQHITSLAQLLVEHVTEEQAPRAQTAGLPPFHAMIAPRQDAGPWQCPMHGGSKLVPAGVSKRTGAAYDAFIVCDQQGCDQRPPRPAAPARAFAPSQPRQLP